MKKKNYLIVILSMLVLCCVCSMKAEAKTYRYVGAMTKKANINKVWYRDNGAIYKAKFTGNKIILWGRLERYSGTNGKKGTLLKNKKRTFKLAGNVKFYSSGGDMHSIRLSRSRFNSTMTRYNGLGLVMYVKNGKVTKMYLCS